MPRQFHRPARLKPEVAQNLPGSPDIASASELAHASAQALLGCGTDETAELTDPITRAHIIAALAHGGIDVVAEMWADCPATTLPGALWRLFLLQTWIRRDPDLIERRYATTVDLRAADAQAQQRFARALTQAQPVAAPTEICAEIESVLSGKVDGVGAQLGTVLNDCAVFLLALAAGSQPDWIEDDADELADRVTRRPSALVLTAQELSAAAARVSSGQLD